MVGLSVLAHMHTPLANQTSSWEKEVTTRTIIPLSPRWAENTLALPTRHSRIVAHPLAGRRPIPHEKDYLLLGLTQLGENPFQLSFTFSTEWYQVCIFLLNFGVWCKFPSHTGGETVFLPHCGCPSSSVVSLF